MKNILDKIFGLKALHFLMLMFVVLALGLIYTPVESTLFGGIVLFLVMAGILFWSYKEYRKRNGQVTTIIAIALFDLSVAAMLGVLWVTFSNHQYHTFQEMTAITYLIGSVSFLQAKEFQHEIIDPFPFWFVVIFAAANVWAVGFILHHYSIDNYVKKRINERLGGAMLISWRQLMDKRVDEKTFDFKVANSKKLSHNKGKYVFESFVERPTTDYYNDFYKDLLVVDGEVHVHFKTGEVEKLTNGKNAIIRPYEVHRLEPKQRSKLIVTCINPDI